MKNKLIHIKNSIKAAWFYYKNPLILQMGALEMLAKILDMLKVSMEEDRPMRSKLVIHGEVVMHLWCSTGITPEERIDQLLEDKEVLKRIIKDLESQVNENKKHICFEASHIECSCKDKCLRNINNY